MRNVRCIDGEYTRIMEYHFVTGMTVKICTQHYRRSVLSHVSFSYHNASLIKCCSVCLTKRIRCWCMVRFDKKPFFFQKKKYRCNYKSKKKKKTKRINGMRSGSSIDFISVELTQRAPEIKSLDSMFCQK